MGVWAAAIQGVLGVDSAITEGKNDAKQAQANKEMADMAAADALQRGAAEAGQMRQAGAQLAARQAVAYANSGVDASVGTAANVQAGTAAQAELEALTLENNSMREAFGYKKHGIDFQTQAGLNAARRNREVAGTILGTAGTITSGWAKKKGDS